MCFEKVVFVKNSKWPRSPLLGWPAQHAEGAFLDIGADTGLDTAFYAIARRSASQHVLSVECSDQQIQRLRERFSGLPNVSFLHSLLPGGREKCANNSTLWRTTPCRQVAGLTGPVLYAKVDVEESTWSCVKSLCAGGGPRPRYP